MSLLIIFCGLFVLEVHGLSGDVLPLEDLDDLPWHADDVEDGDDQRHQPEDLTQGRTGDGLYRRQAISLGCWF